VEYRATGALVERDYLPDGTLRVKDISHEISLVNIKEQPSDFDPLRYMPLGIGQWVQGRPIMGGVLFTSILGIGLWHVSTVEDYSRVRQDGRLAAYKDARFRQNLSAGFLYGAVAISTIEAIVVDWLE